MYTKICLPHKLRTFWRIGANVPVHVSSRAHFAKIENEKVLSENQCEKHNKLEFRRFFNVLALISLNY